MGLPAELSQAIEGQIAGHDRKLLARAVEEVSLRYRSNFSAPKPAISSDLERAAYLVTRLPATYAAVHGVLTETKPRIPAEIASLLDLGAGPGTAAWAAADVFPVLTEITLAERSPAFIEVGRALASHSQSTALGKARWMQADLESAKELPPHDLVVVSYSLGELQDPATFLEKAWLAARIALVIVEPGTPRGFKTVLQARSRLLAAGGRLVTPCPHEQECPMAGSSKDWCHFAQRLQRSQLHRQAKSGSLGHEDEKFSYIVAAKAEARRAPARVVRHPLQHKGHIKLQLCTPQGLQEQVVTRSHREAFRRARQAEWGSEWESRHS